MNIDKLKGKFIVFDGGEGCGKSTQAKMLQEKLADLGLHVLHVRDPGSTRISEQIRSILLNPDHTEMSMRCEMLLYMAARAQMMKQVIVPALDAGALVLSDRFVSSTLAYQLGGDNLSAEEIRKVADVAINSRWPDLTIIFDMPLASSAQRVQEKFVHVQTLFGEQVETKVKDRIEQRSNSYHEFVRKNFLSQAKYDKRTYRVINADQSTQDVHRALMILLEKWTSQVKGRSIMAKKAAKAKAKKAKPASKKKK